MRISLLLGLGRLWMESDSILHFLVQARQASQESELQQFDFQLITCILFLGASAFDFFNLHENEFEEIMEWIPFQLTALHAYPGQRYVPSQAQSARRRYEIRRVRTSQPS